MTSSQLLLIFRDTAHPPGYGVALMQEVVVLPVMLNHWSRLMNLCDVAGHLNRRWSGGGQICTALLLFVLINNCRNVETPWYWNDLHIAGAVCREFTAYRWIPITKGLQEHFVDAWHQNVKHREIYFWMNNINSWVGLPLFIYELWWSSKEVINTLMILYCTGCVKTDKWYVEVHMATVHIHNLIVDFCSTSVYWGSNIHIWL